MDYVTNLKTMMPSTLMTRSQRASSPKALAHAGITRAASLIALTVLTMARTCLAQTAEGTAPPSSAPTVAIKQPPRPLATGFRPYPAEAMLAGHQGLVRLRFTIKVNRQTGNVELMTSSRSPTLDRAAMQAATVWRFTPAMDANGEPVASKAVQNVVYRKDSGDSLPSKKCSELNTDLAWFKTAYAELPLSKMPVYGLSLALLLDGSGPTSGTAEAIKVAYPPAFKRALARCAAQPDGLYWDALTSELPGKR